MADIKNFGIAGIGADVQLGKRGVRITSSNGVMTVAGASSGLAPIRAADPVSQDDLTTRRFVETNGMFRATLVVNEGTPASIELTGTILRITAIVTEAFSNPSTLINDATVLLSETDFASTAEGLYEAAMMQEVDGLIEFTQTGSGSGTATIVIEYLAP